MALQLRMKRAPLVVLSTLVAGMLSSGADLHLRIQVITVGDDAKLSNRISLALSHALEQIDGVIATRKEPDYIVGTTESQVDQRILLSVSVEEVLEQEIARRVLLRTENRKEPLEAGNGLFYVFRRVDHTDLRIATAETIDSVCSEIVRGIDGATFERERQYPRGLGFDRAFTNLMLRSGAKRIQ